MFAQACKRGADHPTVYMRHHLVALGCREKCTRRHQAACFVPHTQQHFETRPVIRAIQSRNWLCQQLQLIAVERLLNLCGKVHVVMAFDDARIGAVVNLDAVTTMVFGRFAGHAC